MSQAPVLLGPTGKPMIALGGEYAYKQFRKGDIVCALQWINDDPSICLFPADQNRLGVGAFVIGMSALHKYVESDGNPTKHMIRMAVGIAVQLGFQPGKDICFRIVETVLDAAEDLLRMPPSPTAVLKAQADEPIGDLTVKSGGKIILETAV